MMLALLMGMYASLILGDFFFSYIVLKFTLYPTRIDLKCMVEEILL